MYNDPIITLIRNAIKGTEFEGKTYLCGGFVRDHIMGNTNSKDRDIVVSILDGGIKLAEYLYATHNTTRPVIFRKFGTAQLVIDGESVEFVMTRNEWYDMKSRKPRVEFGSIANDVIRRDFTINALLYDISNDQIIDIVNGVNDIKNKIIKTTNNPELIFKEDPLRILRAIRFSTTLGFSIETNTFAQLKKHVKYLSNISSERIRDELGKIIVSNNVRYGMRLLIDSGILNYMTDIFSKMKKLPGGKYHIKNPWEHTLDVMENTQPTVEHRLAALFHDTGKISTISGKGNDVHFYGHQLKSVEITRTFMERYCYSNAQIDTVLTAIGMHMEFIEQMKDSTIRKRVDKFGKDQMLFCCDLALADSKHRDRIKIVENIRHFVSTDVAMVANRIEFPVNGYDIMNYFKIKSGKRVGELLDRMKEYYYEEPAITKKQMLKKLSNSDDIIINTTFSGSSDVEKVAMGVFE